MNPSPKTAFVILGDASSSDGQSPSMIGDAIIAINDRDKLALALQDMMPSSLESITLHINDITKFDPMAVAGLIEPLADKGTFRIVVPSSVDDSSTSKLVSKAFLLAGLTAESEQRLTDGTRTYTALKKSLVTSHNGGRKLNLEEEKKQDDGRVMLNADDDDDDDDNLIDEDALLDGNADDMLAPPDMTAKTSTAGDDCGGRKACDNCTCGRAEREKGGSPKKQVPTSSCGNCAKGDAFRCASCPFLGKPAFKPGEEHLILELTDDI